MTEGSTSALLKFVPACGAPLQPDAKVEGTEARARLLTAGGGGVVALFDPPQELTMTQISGSCRERCNRVVATFAPCAEVSLLCWLFQANNCKCDGSRPGRDDQREVRPRTVNTSTLTAKVRDSDACNAPTPTSLRAISSPCSLRIDTTTEYSDSGAFDG